MSPQHRRTAAAAVFAVLTAFALVEPAHAQQQVPETLYIHGDILTGVGLRAFGPSVPQRVQAMAVKGGKILATGTDAQILTLKRPGMSVVDLHGAFVMPGFNDAHTHMAQAGQQRLSVDLDNIPSLAAMQDKIRAYAAALPAGASVWITGGGWDHTKWPSGKLPTRQDLDAVTGNHPAFLERTDGHIAVVNSAALAAAHITAATPAPQGGQIDLDPTTHEPTGIIRDAAVPLVRGIIPPPDAATRRRALTVAMQDASSHGVTSVQDFSDIEDYKVLAAMEADSPTHDLPVRFAEWMPFDLPIPALKAYQALHDPKDAFLHTTQLKGFMDGSLGSRTAALAAPYADDPANSGLPRYDQAKLDAMAAERAAAGFQLGFHAIGDRANAMALDAFAAADKAATEKQHAEAEACFAQHPEKRKMADACGTLPRLPLSRQFRFRIEHAQVILPADFDRFARLGVIASMQPSHLLTDMAWAPARLGDDRTKYAYAWRTFLEHKVPLAFGTDYPVESINPFRGLYSAVTRQNEAGTQTFHPEEKLTIEEALYAYTQVPAFAQSDERTKGRLEAGFVADFIVLDRDPLKATPQQLLQTRVLRTVTGGITRFTAETTPATADLPHTAHPDGD